MGLTNFDNSVIGQRAITAKKHLFSPFTSFSYKVDGVSRFKTVKVPIVGAVGAAAAFAEDTNDYFDASASNESTVSVALTDCLKNTFSYTESELQEITEETMTAKWGAAFSSVATGAMNFIMGKVLAADFGAAGFTGAASLFDSESIVDLRAAVESAMGEANIPLNAILSPAYYNALRKDDDIKTLFASSGDISPVTGVVVPNVSGTSIYQSTVPANAQNLVGFVCDPSAIAVGFGYEPSTGSDDTIVTDPITGISIRMHEERKPGSKIVFFTAEVLLGAVAANTKALSRIISA